MLTVTKSALNEILTLRALFLQENNFQIRYDACHRRGWTDSYLVSHHGEHIGYGSVKGNANVTDRDTIFEFYLVPSFRKLALPAFAALLQVANPVFIECQSNDLPLSYLLYQFGTDIFSDTVLLEENTTTHMVVEEVVFRKRKEDDIVFEHKSEPVGTYVLERNHEIVATGGFLLHYNMPFADLYMEVKAEWRRKGFGSFLIQELKRQCYLSGRVPAARTGTDNIASRETLLKAGCRIAGYMLLGRVKRQIV